MTGPIPSANAAATGAADLNPRTDPPLDFPAAAFGELAPSDYAELGFMCGLEVHQQLDTARKLFCRCPAGHRTTRVDAEVLRHMRPTLSEMGEYDGCALMEYKTRKEIVYWVARESVCTYELDDTPPFPINETAVRIALQVAQLFDLSPVSELHVMRKQYLDGSIPTGFQRTGMVALGGRVPFLGSELGGDRHLRIRQLSLEEDSCREVSDIGHRITFRTDRLGTPLIETVTEPDLLTPLDAAAGGRLLAQIARTSGKVRRGPGAARQDVNVSIAGSRRIEIKGVCSHRLLPLLVHNEAYRHLNLLRLRAELERRGAPVSTLQIAPKGLPWEVSDLVVEAGALLAHCGVDALERARSDGESICAVRLPGFAGLLAHPSQPGRTFGHELAERVRVIACPIRSPLLFHSDQTRGLGPAHWRELRAALRAADGDAVVIVYGQPTDAATAAREVLARAAEAFAGVPSETRQPRPDGSTGFERILPGPQRMYPDTDTPPLPIPDSWIAIDRRPEAPWDRVRRYVELGLTPAAAARLVDHPWNDLFDDLAPNRGTAARRIAAALEKRLPYHWRTHDRGRAVPAVERLRPWAAALSAATLAPCAAEAVLDRLLREPETSAPSIVADHAPAADAATVLEQLRDRGAAMDLPNKQPGARLRAAMGTAMRGQPIGVVDPMALRWALVEAMQPEASS